MNRNEIISTIKREGIIKIDNFLSIKEILNISKFGQKVLLNKTINN